MVELRDFIVTPFLIVLVYAAAYLIRNRVTDVETRPYFFPALTLKIIGALAVGFIYQFYYGGGDTFNYHTHGSRHIWEAFTESPSAGLKLMFSKGEFDSETYRYAARIPFYRDPSSFFVVRVASFFDLITFSSYSATAILFAVLSFSGVWSLYTTMKNLLPERARLLSVAVLFVPSVFFWGSGLLKDSLTLASVGWITYGAYRIFIERRMSVTAFLLLTVGCYFLYSVKLYILLCLAPAVIAWIFFTNFSKIRSTILRIMISPMVIGLAVLAGFQAVTKIAEEDSRYAIDNIAETARITAYDIGFYTGRGAGSRYTLGELDGSFASMITKAPQAINVSLFRPYLWEVNNVLMLVSALESLILLAFTLYILFKTNVRFFRSIKQPSVIFFLAFSLTFAFAVGISTYNFGTLVRYKIPLMPFYVSALIFIDYYARKNKETDPRNASQQADG